MASDGDPFSGEIFAEAGDSLASQVITLSQHFDEVGATLLGALWVKKHPGELEPAGK